MKLVKSFKSVHASCNLQKAFVILILELFNEELIDVQFQKDFVKPFAG